jgi:integrase
MPRPRPPHLHCERTRHGKRVWYVRVGKGPRVRIHEEFGSSGFVSEYQDAVSGKTRARETHHNGTLGWLVARYREADAWMSLSLATRRQRECILKQVLATAAAEPIARVDRKAIIAGRERRARTPFQARHFVATMRGLFTWAVEAELAKADPTQGVKVRRPKTEGFPAWDDADIDAFTKRWPIGTRERVMFDIFRFTGFRRGDAARLGRPHVAKGVITISTQKGAARVTIPMLPELARTLDAGPTGDLTYIATASGKPMPKESVGNLFADACRAAGLKKSAHGLRKYAAALLANRGATVAQLEAVFGWEGGRMAALYTKSADRERLAASAITKLRK